MKLLIKGKVMIDICESYSTEKQIVFATERISVARK